MHRPLLTGLLCFALSCGCSAPDETVASPPEGILAGGGAEAPLAKRLAAGELNPAPERSTNAGPSSPAPAAGAPAPAESEAPEEEVQEVELESPLSGMWSAGVTRTGGETEGASEGRRSDDEVFQGAGRGAGLDPDETRERHREVVEGLNWREERGQGQLEADESKEKAAPPPVVGGWKRGTRPSFARVEVGDGNALDLKRMRITVTIEGARARTIVDHVFANPHDQALEGTFEYPLPTSASPSYYAMFLTGSQDAVPEFFPQGAGAPVALASMPPAQAMGKVDKAAWGELREARVVHREKARRTYEGIVRKRIDPALLEHVGGNTFRGRVFPIRSQGLNRVIVAFDQHLDVTDGRVQYRLNLPDCQLDLLRVTVVVDRGGVAATTLLPQGAASEEADGKISYDLAWENEKGPGGELVLAMTPKDPQVQATGGADPSGKGRTFYARLRPDLPAKTETGYAKRAAFLLDTSFSQEPDRFNANLAILRQVLTQDTAIEEFNVMCIDVGAAWVAPAGWVANDAAGRDRVFALLDDVLLEGATDLSVAVDLLASTDWGAREPGYVFLLTDGQLNWGERDPARLATEIEQIPMMEPRVFCYRTGLGAENLRLFRALTRRGGGIFNVTSEKMAAAAGLAHRRPAFVVEDVTVEGASDVLVAGRQCSLFPGGELVVAGRYSGTAPKAVVVHGELAGTARVLRFPLDLDTDDTLADRAWAEIAVEQLLGLGDASLETLATAYAQRYRIGSRVTSFLVLETDQEYEQYDIRKESGDREVEDVAIYLGERYASGVKVQGQKDAWRTFLASRGGQVKEEVPLRLLAQMHEQDLSLPPGVRGGEILRRDIADAAYLLHRRDEAGQVKAFIAEAARRIRSERTAAAVRALSTVVETNPGRTDAMRLVGYRLMELGQPGPAAHVFDRVRLDRPFEPHAYRDLARSLELAARFPLAALQYEVLLAGTWNDRFASIRVVAKDEYRRLLGEGLQSGTLGGGLLSYFEKRRNQLGGSERPDALRVTISWNTDNTDVDLWVVEPGGEACGYNHRKTAQGGELLDDLTGGYGPERYCSEHAVPGEYTVLVHYYSTNPNLLAGETHVEVVVERRGAAKRFQVVLDEKGSAFEVCTVRF